MDSILFRSENIKILLINKQGHERNLGTEGLKKIYRQEHQRKVETKRQRVESKKKQIKELMEKQKIDKARGASYGARVAIESYTFQISAAIKEIETKKKLELNLRCSW